MLTFRALTVTVDNPTNQWVRLDGIGVYVPQYTLGATYSLPGTARAQASFNAPPGQVQPPTIAGQAATVTFYDLARVTTPGVGMLGGRAPYYDRNPLSIVKANSSVINANTASAAAWSYTVPAGRRAYVETGECITQITVAYANNDARIDSLIAVFPGGGAGIEILLATIYHGLAAGTFAGAVIGASIELQPADVIQGQTSDGRAAGAGSSLHFVSAKFTEFDA